MQHRAMHTGPCTQGGGGAGGATVPSGRGVLGSVHVATPGSVHGTFCELQLLIMPQHHIHTGEYSRMPKPELPTACSYRGLGLNPVINSSPSPSQSLTLGLALTSDVRPSPDH